MTEPTEEVNVHPGRPPSAPAAASDSAASTSSTPSTGARAKSVSKKKAVRVPCRLRVSHSGEPEHTRKLARTHTRTHSHFIAEMCHRVWTSSSLPRGSLRGFLFAIKKCLLSAHASRGGGNEEEDTKRRKVTWRYEYPYMYTFNFFGEQLLARVFMRAHVSTRHQAGTHPCIPRASLLPLFTNTEHHTLTPHSSIPHTSPSGFPQSLFFFFPPPPKRRNGCTT